MSDSTEAQTVRKFLLHSNRLEDMGYSVEVTPQGFYVRDADLKFIAAVETVDGLCGVIQGLEAIIPDRNEWAEATKLANERARIAEDKLKGK